MRIALEPVFVVGFEPVDAPIFEGEERDGTHHLIVIGQRGDEVVFGQRLAHLVCELIIGRVTDAEDVDALFLQTVTEIPIDARELRGYKDKVHDRTS